MPEHCFVHGGVIVRRRYDKGECPETVSVMGHNYVRCDEPATRAIKGKGKWPIRSEAVAVHPDQIKEAVAFSKRHGVPTEYDKLGRPEFRSPGHQRRHGKAWGHRNKADYR